MPHTPVPANADAFLRRPNGAVMGTVRRDGAPFTAATWYDWDGSRMLLNLSGGRVRLEHLRRDPRVSVTVFDTSNWYWQLTVTGTAAIEDDADLSGIDRLAQRYIGSAYPDRSDTRVNVWVTPETWNGWDPVMYATWDPVATQPPA